MRFCLRTNWPGYPIGVLLAFGASKGFVVSSLEKYGCSRESCLKDWSWVKSTTSDSGELGHTAVLPCRRVLVWFASINPSRQTIAHEAFHAVMGSLPQLGIPYSDDTEEAYAYAMQNLIGVIDDAVAGAANFFT